MNNSEQIIKETYNVTTPAPGGCHGNGLVEEIRIFLMVALTVMLILCVLGNSLTLVALPYVRDKYKAEFSVLQSPASLLLLHLSLADLLYGVLGYPHFLHGLVVRGVNPFDFPGGDDLCWTLAMLRNWAAQMDFATMGAIAFLACRLMVCKTCEERRDHSNHEDHDKLFRRCGVLGVIFLVWALSLLSILPDCLGVTGGYKWTNTSYGCDNVYSEVGERSYGLIVNVVTNILIIFISYYIVAYKLCRERRLDNLSSESSQKITHHIRMLLRLAITYTICVIPASFLCWGIFETELFPKDNKVYEQAFQATLNCLYWMMYCINFLLYLVPNSGIRRAYIRFFRDVKKRVSAKLKRGIDKTRRSGCQRVASLDLSNAPEHTDIGEDNPNSRMKTSKVTLITIDSDIIYISQSKV